MQGAEEIRAVFSNMLTKDLEVVYQEAKRELDKRLVNKLRLTPTGKPRLVAATLDFEGKLQ